MKESLCVPSSYSLPGSISDHANSIRLKSELYRFEVQIGHNAYDICYLTFSCTIDLYDTLRAYQDLGYIVDTRLHHFAYGLKAANQLDL